MKLPWIKNTKGEPSASLTLVIITFTVVMLWLVLSIFTTPFGLTIAPFNASEAMMVLSPLLLNYWGRRNTDAKSPNNQN
jgi:hypothetical protein